MTAADIPVLRRLPVPQTEPPYDDECPTRLGIAAAPHTQGALALDFVLASGAPAVPKLHWPVHLVEPAEVEASDEEDDEAEFGPQPTERSDLPDPRPVAARLAQAIIEVVNGARPLAQLVRWTSESVYADLERRLTVLAASGPPGTRGVMRPVVRSVHASEPTPGVAEVCALVQRGPRAVALALRLQGFDGRWRCTAAEFG